MGIGAANWSIQCMKYCVDTIVGWIESGGRGKVLVLDDGIINIRVRGCLHVRFPIRIPIRFGVRYAAKGVRQDNF
jgi:hypothetical protein